MAEFAPINNESASTKLSLFFPTKGMHHHISFDIVDLSNSSTCKRIFKQKASDISGNMQTIWEFVWKASVATKKICQIKLISIGQIYYTLLVIKLSYLQKI